MLTWGVKVNEYGNAFLDESGEFLKLPDQGVTDRLWTEMVAFANEKGLKKGDYKKLNLPFDNKLHGLPGNISERMVKAVEDFVFELLTNVFNATDTGPAAIDAILKAGSYDLGPKATRIEDPSGWTESRIRERATKKAKDEKTYDD